uniref:CSON005959 protein n=1 Tax=Culicoides sonorensis TaxID=179676 RepID=A0A336M0V2_CULSO
MFTMSLHTLSVFRSNIKRGYGYRNCRTELMMQYKQDLRSGICEIIHQLIHIETCAWLIYNRFTTEFLSVKVQHCKNL